MFGAFPVLVGYSKVLMAIRYEHIELNKDRVPSIAGTKTKVVELAVEQQAYGWSPEELHFQHSYLKLGQIHPALAYTGTIVRNSTAKPSTASNEPKSCVVNFSIQSWRHFCSRRSKGVRV
jgi:uncharacterized protein (DUF433 family)